MRDVTCLRCLKLISRADPTNPDLPSTVRPAETVVADTLAGAEQLSVAADRIEEVSTHAILVLATRAAGKAYESAAEMLEERGRTLNAREAWLKAAVEFRRSGARSLAQEAERRARMNHPENGNIYGP